MDYGTRIADATNTKNASYGTYNQYAGQADQAYNKYNQQFDQRQGYGDIYDAARNKYMNTDEINAAKGTYQTARDAVDQINTTINKLPESISQQYGGTGLTEAQRQRALQSQYNDLVNTQNYTNMSYRNASSDYNTLRNEGLQQAMHTADTENSNQWQALDALQNNWNTLLGQRNTTYNQYQQDLASLAGINTERDNADWKQKQMDFDRWKVEQENARAAADRNAELNLQKYRMGAQAEQNKAAMTLQQQLADKQSRAGYNAYYRSANAAVDDQFKKDNGNLWNYFWSPMAQAFGGKDYGTSILNKANQGRNSIMSYDKWAGNV